jgi:hypothetical protein
MNTTVANNDEVVLIRNLQGLWYSPITFPSQISSSEFCGIVNLEQSSRRGDLKSTLERLFQNFTVGLLTEPSLR